MAVGFDVASESHTGTTGAASVASFTWNHLGGASARGALVFVFSIGALTDTSVTYGGVAMTAVPYTAADTDTELGSVRAYYLDNCGTGTKAVVVNRTNNAVVMYAVCYTVTAAAATEVYLPGVKTRAGSAAEQTAASSSSTGTATSAGLSSVTDGDPPTASLRFMGRYQGSSAVTAAGTGSTAGPSIDFGLYVIDTFRETTAGTGARNVGGAVVSDDLAWVALAVREKTQAITLGLLDASPALYAPTVIPDQLVTLPLLSSPIYRETVLADSPSAYWRLGEASGTNASDEVGTNDATHVGSPTLGVAGAVAGDTAVLLDGSTQYLTTPDVAALNLGDGPFTVEAWAKLTSVPAGTYYQVFRRGTNSFSLGYNGDTGDVPNTYYLALAGGNQIVRANVTVTDTGWHHVVVTKDGATSQVYIDGVDRTGTVTNQTLTTATGVGNIGRNQSASQYYPGAIDEVAVYPSVLSASRIAAHYAAATATDGAALFAPVVERLSGGTTQTLTIPLLDAGSALYAPSVLPGPVALSLGLLDAGAALYQPTLTPKNAVILGLLDAGSALYAPTLATRNTLTVPLLDAGAALYAPTLAPKSLVAIPLLDAGPALYSPDLTLAPYPVILPLLDAGPALYEPTIVGLGGTVQAIDLGLLDAGPDLYAPTVLPQPVTISLGLLDAGPAVYAPSLGHTVTLPFLQNAPTLYQPTLTPKNTVSLGLLTSTSALYQPTVTPKNLLTIPLLDAGAALYAPSLGHTIAVPLLDASPALYEPTLTQVGGTFQTITLGLLDAGPDLYAPTLIPGAVAIIVPLLDGGAVLYAPTVAQGQAITLGLLDAGAAIYAPTLYAYSPIVLPLLDGEGALYPPVLVNTAVFITGITRDSNGTPLGSVEVHVFRTSDDVEVAQVTSNALGVFSIQVQAGIAHYIVAYKTGTPDRAGTTLNTLVGS